MKSFVMSIFLLQSAFGSALGIALASFDKDPGLVWMYSGLCTATIIAARLFWISFKHLNATEESINALENKRAKAVGVDEIDTTGALYYNFQDRNKAAASGPKLEIPHWDGNLRKRISVRERDGDSRERRHLVIRISPML